MQNHELNGGCRLDVEHMLDFNNKLFFIHSLIKEKNMLEELPGYDKWKTASPVEDIGSAEIDAIEANLRLCPFCGSKPCFENSDEGWFVSCSCGAQMPGDGPMEAAQNWAARARA